MFDSNVKIMIYEDIYARFLIMWESICEFVNACCVFLAAIITEGHVPSTINQFM